MLRGVGGVLAQVVAFVPASRPSGACTSRSPGSIEIEAYIDDNVLGAAIGGAAAAMEEP
jgi:hypothetical protein